MILARIFKRVFTTSALMKPRFDGSTCATIGKDVIFYCHPHSIEEQLKKAFGETNNALPKTRSSLQITNEQDKEPFTASPKRPPPWFVGFAKTFKDDLRSTDRKLQGRILDALSKIVDAPMQLIGDTEKPLTGDLAGFWRYRIGDFRLVYYPDPKSGNITLYHFSSRGDVYA